MNNIEQLQQENTELKSQLEALQAYVEQLREALESVKNSGYWNGEWRIPAWCRNNIDSVTEETPAQSLNHIEARVEEETIERCVQYLGKHDGSALDKDIPRKYAKQEKKEGE